MGRFHRNPEEPGVPPWVCAVCGTPEYIGCVHRNTTPYDLIRESNWRMSSVLKKNAMILAKLKGEVYYKPKT